MFSQVSSIPSFVIEAPSVHALSNLAIFQLQFPATKQKKTFGVKPCIRLEILKMSEIGPWPQGCHTVIKEKRQQYQAGRVLSNGADKRLGRYRRRRGRDSLQEAFFGGVRSWAGLQRLHTLKKRVLLSIAVLVEDFSAKTSARIRGRGYCSSPLRDLKSVGDPQTWVAG